MSNVNENHMDLIPDRDIKDMKGYIKNTKNTFERESDQI
jgi:hypothetical protein